MSILGNIFNKIFHHPDAQQQAQAAQGGVLGNLLWGLGQGI